MEERQQAETQEEAQDKLEEVRKSLDAVVENLRDRPTATELRPHILRALASFISSANPDPHVPRMEELSANPGPPPQHSLHATPENPGYRPRAFADLPRDEQQELRTRLVETLRTRQAREQRSWVLQPLSWPVRIGIALACLLPAVYSYVTDGTWAITTGSEVAVGALILIPLALTVFLRARAQAYAAEDQARDQATLARLAEPLQASEQHA